MKNFLLFAVIIAASTSAFSGSSSPQLGTDGGSIANASTMPRARVWNANRLWQTGDGQILVCEEKFIASSYSYDKKCYAKGDKDESGRWSNLQTKHADGFVLKGYEYRFVGTNATTVLIAYYGPPEAKAEPKPIEKPVAAPSQPGIVQVDQLVIRANKVIVQRKK